MKGFSYLWHMAWRRKAACLLVVVATMVATVFMLFYPGLIENTRKRLEETYQGITVTGSIVSTGISPEVRQFQEAFGRRYRRAAISAICMPADLSASAPFQKRFWKKRQG